MKIMGLKSICCIRIVGLIRLIAFGIFGAYYQAITCKNQLIDRKKGISFAEMSFLHLFTADEYVRMLILRNGQIGRMVDSCRIFPNLQWYKDRYTNTSYTKEA